MDIADPKTHQGPGELLREVIELCADCDTCRLIMDRDCAFFPELYRLWDQEQATGTPIDSKELRHLVELCTLCGLCPCPKVPMDIMEAKSRFVEAEGLALTTKLLTDIPRLAKLCGTFPRLFNAVQAHSTLGPLARKAVGLHPERELPGFARENFFQWAEKTGLTQHREGERRVTYFAGCTVGYLFPEIGRDLVQLLESAGIRVHVPDQKCCGMPHLVEGDRTATLARADANLRTLRQAVDAGDDVICSCPTCGYFFKFLLKERAVYSETYQKAVGAGDDELKVPESERGSGGHKILKKSLYKNILKDDGYFSELDPLARVEVAGQVYDAGEYLAQTGFAEQLKTGFSAIPERMAYFAPCHQREQKMGSPYLELLALVPELHVEPVGQGKCCGMGGNFGFKVDFHATSLSVGQPLLEQIRRMNPQAIVTDCLSCRFQFTHALSLPVYHPLEVLARASQSKTAQH